MSKALEIQQFISARGYAPIDINDELTCTPELNLKAFRLFADMSKHFNIDIYFTSTTNDPTITHFTDTKRRHKLNIVHATAKKNIRKRCKTAQCGPKMRSTLTDTISAICAFKSVHFVPSFSFENIQGGIRLIVHITTMTASDIETIMYDAQELTFSQGYLQCDFYEQNKRRGIVERRTESEADSAPNGTSQIHLHKRRRIT